MIIDDFDVKGIDFAKFETDPLSVIDGHGPLVSAIALQLVQSDTAQRAGILKAARGIQS